MLFPFQLFKQPLEVLWGVYLLLVAECQKMLQTEVYPQTILLLDVSLELGARLRRVDDERDEVLPSAVHGNRRSPDFSLLDTTRQNKLKPVVAFLLLQELRNLDFPCFEINLNSSRDFKTLVMVVTGLELRESALMAEEPVKRPAEVCD